MPLHSNIPRYARTHRPHLSYNKKSIEQSTETLFVPEVVPEVSDETVSEVISEDTIETVPEDIQESTPETESENVQEDIPEIINNNE